MGSHVRRPLWRGGWCCVMILIVGLVAAWWAWIEPVRWAVGCWSVAGAAGGRGVWEMGVLQMSGCLVGQSSRRCARGALLGLVSACGGSTSSGGLAGGCEARVRVGGGGLVGARWHGCGERGQGSDEGDGFGVDDQVPCRRLAGRPARSRPAARGSAGGPAADQPLRDIEPAGAAVVRHGPA